MKKKIVTIFILLFIFYYCFTFSILNNSSKCKYTDDKFKYDDLLCSYQIEKYIAIYDLCYEDYPNFSCFISTSPLHIFFSVFNNTVMRYKKIYCNSGKCNYIKPIKGNYPLPRFNKKKSLMKLRNRIKEKKKGKRLVNIILGSGISYNNKIDKISDNWISTDQDMLDVTNRYDITQHLNGNTVNNMIAMHVFEHISYYNIFNSFLNIKYLLKKGGKIILCMPDINAKYSPYWHNYTEAINVQPLYGHRVIYSYKSLKYIIEKTHLSIYPLSYHNENGVRIVKRSNFIFFKSLDISEYIISQIEKDLGYSICSIILNL